MMQARAQVLDVRGQCTVRGGSRQEQPTAELPRETQL
jgi:hypothetical protein